MPRLCLLCALLLVTHSVAGQPGKEPPYQVPAPAGWAKETIPLPSAFAPDMKWKGAEELRFAPGMFKANAPDKHGKRPDGEPMAVFAGELKWVEPFATGKPQTLRMEIHTWHCEKHKHHCVFICASPQPEAAAVWKTLREIRSGCTCR